MCAAQINLRDDTDEIQDYLAQLTGGRSVPRVRRPFWCKG
jgi:hypothetical protein